MASNRTVNGGSKNTPIVEEYHARETEDLNEGKVMPRPRPKGKWLNLFFISHFLTFYI